MKLKVELQDNTHLPNTPKAKDFQQWVNAALQLNYQLKTPIPSLICIRLVSKIESADLNQNYRHKKGPTNILSFAYEPMPGIESTSLGDLAICTEIVIEEAKLQNKDLLLHFAHLTIHGTLHLQGFDHIKEEEAKIMEQMETNIMLQLGLPDPYLEKQSKEVLSHG